MFDKKANYELMDRVLYLKTGFRVLEDCQKMGFKCRLIFENWARSNLKNDLDWHQKVRKA